MIGGAIAEGPSQETFFGQGQGYASIFANVDGIIDELLTRPGCRLLSSTTRIAYYKIPVALALSISQNISNLYSSKLISNIILVDGRLYQLVRNSSDRRQS